MQYTVKEEAVSCAVIVPDVQGIHVSRLSVLFQLLQNKREISIGETIFVPAPKRKLGRTRRDIEIVRIETPV